MKINNLIKLSITVFALILTLTGCGDGGTTASGIGASVNGNWSGTFNTNNKPFSTFTMSLSQPSSSLSSPFEDSDVSGNLNSSHPSIKSGSISGKLQESNINMTVGSISMTGSVKANSMSGSWSSSNTATSTTTSLSGTWRASR